MRYCSRNGVGALLGGLLAVSALMGCESEQKRYAGLEFDVQSAPPALVDVRSESVQLPAGIAVKVAAQIKSSELAFEPKDELVLRAKDESVLELFQTGKPREVFLVGNNPGETCLEVLVNGELQECIAVSVSSQ